MRKIIEQLRDQREKAKDIFIENSLIKRASVVNSPLPDTESYLDEIYSLNKAISILENHGAKTTVANFFQDRDERREKPAGQPTEYIRGTS
jgi:hypothetical protein